LPASKEKPVARTQTSSDSESSTVSIGPSSYCELDQLLRLDQDIECHAEEEALEDSGFCGEQDDAETDKYLDAFKTLQISAQKQGALTDNFALREGHSIVNDTPDGCVKDRENGRKVLRTCGQ